LRSSKVSKEFKRTGVRRKAEPQSHLMMKLGLESDPQTLSVVRATVERAAEVLHFPEAESRAIVRSVDEALANILRHAYKGKGGLPIELTCRRLHRAGKGSAPDGIEIILEDRGAAADASKFKGRKLEELRPGGLGLHFIRQSMDQVEFCRKKGKNQLRLVKFQSPAARASKPEGE